MFSEQELENLVRNSPASQEFFRHALLVLFSENLFNDFYLNTALKQIFSISLDKHPRYGRYEKILLRIRDGESGHNIWREMDYQTFALLCVQEFTYRQNNEQRHGRLIASEHQELTGREPQSRAVASHMKVLPAFESLPLGGDPRGPAP